MEYQEIVTAYKAKGLDCSELKTKLKLSEPLVGRAQYRAAFDIVPRYFEIDAMVKNLLVTPENEDKLEGFDEELDQVLNSYFEVITNSIKDVNAWRFIRLVPSDYSKEKFNQMSFTEKMQAIDLLTRSYQDFLEYQKVADLRDTLNLGKDISDDKILRLKFLITMFEALENPNAKTEFFCFDRSFLMALVNFRKKRSVGLKLDDYLKTNSNSRVQFEYEKLSKYAFFTNTDFRDISECIMSTQKTLRISTTNVIQAFSELSETESEKQNLGFVRENIVSLTGKLEKMLAVKAKKEKDEERQRVIEEAQREVAERKRLAEEKVRKEQEELERQEAERLRIEKEKEAAEKARVIGEEEGNTGSNAEQIKQIAETPLAREQVNPLIFFWLEREDTTLTRRVSSKNLTAFFDKIKQIEAETGVRVSLFLVTNVGKEIALKRMQEFQKKARVQGLDRLIEGVLGGYSSFKIDTEGNITDLATISEANRTKIVRLLESPFRFNLPKELIDPSEECYIRYLFSDKRDKSIDMRYLKFFVSQLLLDKNVAKQPLKLLPFIEGKCSGIDVLLNSQVQGIMQLNKYYNTKYAIAPGKTMQVKIDEIKEFIGDTTQKNISDGEDSTQELKPEDRE